MKYKIILNWYGENHEFYTTAKNEKIAKANAMGKLAKEVGMYFLTVKAYYNQNKDNWSVTKV